MNSPEPIFEPREMIYPHQYTNPIRRNTLGAYMDLVRCKRAMKLTIGGINHFNGIAYTHAPIGFEDIWALLRIFGAAGNGPIDNLFVHSEKVLRAWNKCDILSTIPLLSFG